MAKGHPSRTHSERGAVMLIAAASSMVLVAFLFGILQIFYLSTAVSQAQRSAERVSGLVARGLLINSPEGPASCIAAQQAFRKMTSHSQAWGITFGYRDPAGTFHGFTLDECMANWNTATAAVVTLDLSKGEVSGIMNPLFDGYPRPAPMQNLVYYDGGPHVLEY